MPAKDATKDVPAAGPPPVVPGDLFGQADGITPRLVTLEALNELTLKQLLEGAKRLGLTAVSKLKKDALVKTVLDAWHSLEGHHQPSINGKDQHSPTSRAGAVDAPASPAAAAAGPATAPAPSAVSADGDGTVPHAHKFEVGEPGRASSAAAQAMVLESARSIPWGYGRDRVTAAPVDPDRLFVYWEVLDDAIAAARSKLGPGGAHAWLSLRVYDTTGRIFDGTNAHHSFDHRIERGDRQWFFTIGRPASELIVEIGMKSDEGYFVKIARSGRVEFPRREPAAPSDPEWMTVRVSTGAVERPGGHGPLRPARPASAAVSAPASSAPGPTGHSAGDDPPAGGTPHGLGLGAALRAAGLRSAPWEDALHFAAAGGVERHEWQEIHSGGAIEELRQFRWDGPATITTWESGPFTYPVEIPEPVREVFVAKTRVFKVGGRTHVVYGPWQVVIRGLGAQQSRAVLSRWEVYRTWAQELGRAVVEGFSTNVEGEPRAGALGASEMMAGASERRWRGGSELRLGGASEVYFLKASELRLGGASERLFAGASEWMLRGASERRFAGASELVMRGASERLYAGASENLRGGASERALGFLGASEGRLRDSSRAPEAVVAAPPAGDVYPAPPWSDGQPGAEDDGGGEPSSSSTRGGS